MKKTLYILLITTFAILCIGKAYSQPKQILLPGYNMKTLDMNNSNDPVLNTVPITTNPMMMSDCEINNYTLEPENLNINFSNCLEIGYRGQRPVFAHQVVTSKDGEVLFYIVDNFIYNKHGNAIESETNISGYLSLVDGYDPYTINSAFSIGSVTVEACHLYNKIIVVPKPGSCNKFYVFFMMIPNDTDIHSLLFPYIFCKEIEYIDEETINISAAISLGVNGIIEAGGACGDARGYCMNISEYSHEYNDYLLTVEWVNAIRIFRITENMNSIANSHFTWQLSDYYPHTVFFEPNENSSDINNYGHGSYQNGEHGVAIAGNILIEDDNDSLLFIKAGRGFVTGRNVAYPAISYYKFPRNFNAITQSSVKSKSILYDKAYTIGNSGGSLYKFRNICDMEISPNKNYLYVTFMEMDSIYYFDISSFMSGLSEFPHTYNKLDAGGNYRYSELKLLGDGKIYAVEHIGIGNSTDGYGKLTTINNPNAPGTTTVSRNLYPSYQLKRLNLAKFGAVGLPDQWRRRYIFSHTYNSDYETMYPPTYHKINDWNEVSLTNWSPGKTNNPFGSESGDVYINGNLTIPYGKHITINNMTLHFCENKRLVIDVRGSLTLNNCTLTVDTSCNENALWDGIRVRGSGHLEQSSLTHGKVTITGNTVIKNAKRGVESLGGGNCNCKRCNIQE
ncbi:hypothetical protein LJC11_01825 [Bacteroidales bacterium OttesenSCG-928-I21]|nr:hypothetical protein [Bacteroidales bacterium OttesenSCG-928-I21]